MGSILEMDAQRWELSHQLLSCPSAEVLSPRQQGKQPSSCPVSRAVVKAPGRRPGLPRALAVHRVPTSFVQLVVGQTAHPFSRRRGLGLAVCPVQCSALRAHEG